MGSVYVTWNGRCASADTRQALLLRIGELAELSHAQFDVPRKVRSFDATIEGTVLIDPSLLEDTELARPAEVHAPGGLELKIAGPLGVQKPKGPAEFLRVSQVRLEGLEFRLYDGRGLYPGVCSPTIHLRYYCEEGIDYLLAWTKHFYVPGLTWCRYQPMSGYEAWAGIDPASAATRDAVWEMLLRGFHDEVAQWSETAASARAFWDALGKAHSN